RRDSSGQEALREHDRTEPRAGHAAGQGDRVRPGRRDRQRSLPDRPDRERLGPREGRPPRRPAGQGAGPQGDDPAQRLRAGRILRGVDGRRQTRKRRPRRSAGGVVFLAAHIPEIRSGRSVTIPWTPSAMSRLASAGSLTVKTYTGLSIREAAPTRPWVMTVIHP